MAGWTPVFSAPPAEEEFCTLRWQALTVRQKRSLLILPALAAVGSPAMALLPALAQQLHPQDAAGLALPLLFARSLGQLCGPMLLKREPDALCGPRRESFAWHLSGRLWNAAVFVRVDGMCAGDDLYRASGLECSLRSGTFGVLSSFHPRKPLRPAVKPGAGKRSAPLFSPALQQWLPGLAQYRRSMLSRQRPC
jgi:hypothetical protein